MTGDLKWKTCCFNFQYMYIDRFFKYIETRCRSQDGQSGTIMRQTLREIPSRRTQLFILIILQESHTRNENELIGQFPIPIFKERN